MPIVYLCIVFAVIVVLLALKRPLWQAICGGLLACAVAYRIPPSVICLSPYRVLSTWSSAQVLLSIYMITYLQRMLEARSQIRLAQRDLDGIFHNRRMNVIGATLFIGVLPSAAAMILCGDIVKEASEGHLRREEQAFITSWLRHIPESTLPTYSGVLLMSTLSGIKIPGFMLCMAVPLVFLTAIGYYPFVRRLPKDPGTPRSENRLRDAASLLGHIWTLLLIIALILVFGIPVAPSVAISVAIGLVVYRFRPSDCARMIVTAFEMRLLLNSFLVLVLKEFLAYTGVLQSLPEVLSALPIPTYMVFALLFFIGSVISGNAATIAMGTTIAFAAIPDGGAPLMVLLMCFCHAAMQVSPTHVCLVVAAEYYGISLGALIRKTLPRTLLFCVLATAYYKILTLFM